ncbi:hypothetical protein PsYK624_018910 [Phanerochaete sordida]|uniref:Uncharacterized protein n=1 Tax=Phanerochaete sordida TaxID=48140 RepID=A0A9P3L9K2_9APHY|nr:hypothetical protein PsYK624_018910 [Phanerochaete sordida]
MKRDHRHPEARCRASGREGEGDRIGRRSSVRPPASFLRRSIIRRGARARRSPRLPLRPFGLGTPPLHATVPSNTPTFLV